MNPADTIDTEILQKTIDHFWDAFPLVWNSVRGHIRAIAADQFDISVEQFHILRNIRKGVCSVSDLAEVRQISRSAISQTIDTLVNKGLVLRQQNCEDRRHVNLELTSRGSELLNTLFSLNRNWMEEKLAPYQPEDLENIMQALEILKEAFDETTLTGGR